MESNRPFFMPILRCPACHGHNFDEKPIGLRCKTCDVLYPLTKTSALDMRLQSRQVYRLSVSLGAPMYPPQRLDFAPLKMKTNPAVDFGEWDVPHHLTRELLSHFPKARDGESRVLDLGCGNEVHRSVCEHAGFRYIGIDYSSRESMMLGDAHALPFLEESFEFVLSIAVLEHIRHPYVMTQEVSRVLQKGGYFIGTVSFLEPFHADSYYHHTHLGVQNSLDVAGFEIIAIAPSREWPVLIAQANMILFPKMPRWLSKLLVLPLHYLHVMWWLAGQRVNPKATQLTRVRYTTGAFAFIARKAN